ncbi:transposase [Belnapia sp. F-4-1]|uniref:transposase n=1 Tax=Belnapia sp. F-4-1 TaxID=1545443 RepID=UPI0009DDB046
MAITTTPTLRAVFRLAWRQTQSLIGSILQLLGLDFAVLDYSTLSRRVEALDMARPRCGGGPVHLLVNSTRPRLLGPYGTLKKNHGTQRRRDEVCYSWPPAPAPTRSLLWCRQNRCRAWFVPLLLDRGWGDHSGRARPPRATSFGPTGGREG